MSIFKNRAKKVFNDSFDISSFICRGIEREALRVNSSGLLSDKEHNSALGKSLCHPFLTTDFSESLLEFITPSGSNLANTLAQLSDLHIFAAKNIDPEIFWASSMPCHIADPDAVKLANYGNSFNARFKHLYRKGLLNRYGALMQLISGLHFNISFSDDFLRNIFKLDGFSKDLASYKNTIYFNLIKNFNKHSWVVSYLFGSSFAFSKNFADISKYDIKFSQAADSWFLEHATSLRMSGLGYQSVEQQDLHISFNSLSEYAATLRNATQLRSDVFAQIPKFDANLNYNQISNAVLQIENEFYSEIRPKSVVEPGATMLESLLKKGVNYIEIRNLDVNPYSAIGINAAQTRFLDLLTLISIIEPNVAGDQGEVVANSNKVVWRGRQPNLRLHLDGKSILLNDWLQDIFGKCSLLADILDSNSNEQLYKMALEEIEPMFFDANQTISGRLFQDFARYDYNYQDLFLDFSIKNFNTIRSSSYNYWSADNLQQMSLSSVTDFNNLEQISQQDFNSIIAEKYFNE